MLHASFEEAVADEVTLSFFEKNSATVEACPLAYILGALRGYVRFEPDFYHVILISDPGSGMHS